MTQTLKFTQNDVQIEIDFQTAETSVFQEARLSKDINFIVKPSDLGEDFPQSKIIQKIFELADQFKTQDEYLQDCADPEHFNKEAYLTPDVKTKSWSEIDSYVVFRNSENSAGEADLKADFGVVDDDGYVVETDQYVGYSLSETFTMEKFHEMMTKFVDELNQLTDTQYGIKLPEDEDKCARIFKLAS